MVLRLRFDDFSRATRSHTLPRATVVDGALLAAARQLVAAAAPLIAERGLTLVGFAVSDIDRSGAQQLMLPFGEPERRDLAGASTRPSTGSAGATASPHSPAAVLVGRDPGLEMPHLPD